MDLENREMQRIQVIGRAIMSHVQQLFRNADLFDANNQIFGKLSTTLSNYVEESFKLFGACTLRINAHQVFLEDNRVFVDAGMIESVNFLTQIFNNGEISGFSFHQECTVPDTLLKSLFAFREALINDKAKGVDAIVKGLTRRHVPYLSPLPQMENPTTMTGIRDLENAKKFCLRNAAKIILFLEEFGLSVEKEELPKMNILYRLIMNLMRIQETYPHLVTGLIHFPIKDPFQDQAFRSIVLLLTVGKTLAMDRRTQIDLCTASIFQKYGYLTIPTVVRNSPRIDEFLRTVSERGAKKILETKFVNRALYLRLVTAYQTPLQPNDLFQANQICPFAKLLRTINFLLANWKPSQPDGQHLHQAAQRLFQSQDPNLDKPFLLLTLHALGFFHSGQTLIHENGQPMIVVQTPQPGNPELILNGVIKDPISGYPKMRFDQSDPAQFEALMHQLRLVPPGERRPNPLRVLY